MPHGPGRSLLLAGALLVAGAAAAADEPAGADPAAAVDPEVEQALALVRPEGVRAHMRFLADDLLEGRGTATRGFDLGARYVAARFEEMGLAPAGADGYLRPVALRRAWAVPEQSFFEVRRGRARQRLQVGRDFQWSPDFTRPLAEVDDAAVVFVGYGVTAPERGYDDYAGVDCRGRVVIAARGAPAVFDHNLRAYYSSSDVKRQNAVAHGAVAMLSLRDPLRDPEPAERWEERARFAAAAGDLTWMHADGRPDRMVEELAAQAGLSARGVEKLFGRAAGRMREAIARAAQGSPAPFALRARLGLRLASRHEAARSANVVGRLQGSDLAEETLVYTAHLDHLGVDPSAAAGEDAIFNGAYDNASGVAALLEIARAFAALPRPPRRSLLFLAVTGEEEGLLGAEAFLEKPPPGRIVANLNLDMFLMLFPLADVVAFGAEHSSLGPLAQSAARRVGLKLSPDPNPEEVIFVRSDQFAFVRQGVPALFLVSGYESADPAVDGAEVSRRWLREVYHTQKDDLAQPIDHESGARFARVNFLIGWEVANAAAPPRWNPGDFFGERFGGAPAP